MMQSIFSDPLITFRLHHNRTWNRLLTRNTCLIELLFSFLDHRFETTSFSHQIGVSGIPFTALHLTPQALLHLDSTFKIKITFGNRRCR